jgi:hypothetical protein
MVIYQDKKKLSHESFVEIVSFCNVGPVFKNKSESKIHRGRNNSMKMS